jgi:hypothetical protein
MNKDRIKSYVKVLISFIAFLYTLGFILDPVSKSLQGSLINTINLIFHEAGHWMFYIFGKTISICMGSGTEVLIPIICSAYFYLTNQKFSAYFIFYWITIALVDVSVYINDSIVMQIPLLGGDSVIHDWNYLLSSFNLLSYTHFIGQSVFFLASICLIAGLSGTIYDQILKESTH